MSGSDVAFLFSGQGTHRVGMADELLARSDAARALFEEADHALGFSLTGLVRDGPEELLQLTEYVQPALLVLSVAQARDLVARGVRPRAAAGHSVGQFAALVVAGALDLDDAIRLVRERGRLMQEAVPAGRGSMVVVLGLARDVVEECCAARAEMGVATIACSNAPEEFVVSGEARAIEAVADDCDELGGSVVELAVSAPFHCSLLEPMVEEFGEALEKTPFEAPQFDLVDNVGGLPLGDARSVRDALRMQLTTEVRFEAGLRELLRLGLRRFVHCGAERKTMRRWLAAIDPRAEVVPFEDVCAGRAADLARSG